MPKKKKSDPILYCGYNRLLKTRYGNLLFNPNDMIVGKSLEQYGEYSNGETELFRQLIPPKAVILDVGAHIGTHTLFFSKAAGPKGSVLAFEPQRIIFQTLCANMAVNGLQNAYCYQAVVSDSAGFSNVPILDYGLENNFAGLSLGSYDHGDKVAMVTIDSLNLQQCFFIKIDVEGMELSVLKGAKKTISSFHPVLYVENDRKNNSSGLISHLAALGYEMYWHSPPLFNPENYFNNAENIFGNMVSINMLCIHSSMQIHIEGLNKINGPCDWFEPGLYHEK